MYQTREYIKPEVFWLRHFIEVVFKQYFSNCQTLEIIGLYDNCYSVLYTCIYRQILHSSISSLLFAKNANDVYPNPELGIMVILGIIVLGYTIRAVLRSQRVRLWPVPELGIFQHEIAGLSGFFKMKFSH